MSNKLNAEELAAKRYEQECAYYDPQEAYEDAIRKVAQPIADKLDEVTRERDELRDALMRCLFAMSAATALDFTHAKEMADAEMEARAILSKYPKP
jgi:predicted dienelactone hydrolase